MSLVEVLIAVLIVVIGLVTVMSTLSAGLLSVVVAGGQSRATAFARQVVEQFRSLPFDNVVTGTDTPANGVTRTWTVTPVAGFAAPNRLKRIIISVNLTQGAAPPQSIIVETMRAE